MNILAPILEFLSYKVETPASYGWFHLLCFALSVGLGVLLCVTHKPGDEARVRRTVWIVAILVAVLEIYKQVVFTFTVTDGTIVTDFQWYAFPWQFCSMPMYVGLLTLLFRRGRIHRALCSFLATYAVFAGLCVMFYPGDVFVDIAGINLQTMVCHGSMLTVGIYLLYTGYVPLRSRSMLGAGAVFSVAVGLAALLNEIGYHSGIVGEEIFNMFFISPHFDSTLPVYSTVQALVPFPFCLIIYILVFTFAAYLMLLGAWGISWVAKKIKSAHKAPAAAQRA